MKNQPDVPRKGWNPGVIIGLALAAAVLLAVGANAHLVHVATSTQPACVPHIKTADQAPDKAAGAFRAAKSAC